MSKQSKETLSRTLTLPRNKTIPEGRNFATIQELLIMLENKLRNQNATHRSIRHILDLVNSYVYIVDKNGIINHYNNSVEQLHRSTLYGQSFNIVSPLYKKVSFSKMRQYPGALLFLPNQKLKKEYNSKSIDFYTRNITERFSKKIGAFLFLLQPEQNGYLGESILAKTIIETQEKERSRISIDLHDSLGQNLTASGFLIQSALDNLKESENTREMLMKSKLILQEASNAIRRICFNLMPQALNHLGVKEALKELVDSLSASTGLFISLNINLNKNTLLKEFEIDLFRIIQELLSNALRHGNPRNISIDIQAQTNLLIVAVTNDGSEFKQQDDANSGNGIKNIQLRTNRYNGNFNLIGSPETNTRVIIKFPITNITYPYEHIS